MRFFDKLYLGIFIILLGLSFFAPAHFFLSLVTATTGISLTTSSVTGVLAAFGSRVLGAAFYALIVRITVAPRYNGEMGFDIFSRAKKEYKTILIIVGLFIVFTAIMGVYQAYIY